MSPPDTSTATITTTTGTAASTSWRRVGSPSKRSSPIPSCSPSPCSSSSGSIAPSSVLGGLWLFHAIVAHGRTCRALMPGEDESMSDEAIWAMLPHFWVAISMVFFIAATTFMLLKLCGYLVGGALMKPARRSWLGCFIPANLAIIPSRQILSRRCPNQTSLRRYGGCRRHRASNPLSQNAVSRSLRDFKILCSDKCKDCPVRRVRIEERLRVCDAV
ncbi:hypothetical protein MLD38_005497 [Melastoma candidum]|uniref:Uncharacterized protein n=1 Tax=Melastoma candidum TaxID=119954 RepID=A0ACB9RLS6_9MYRT|nr:hypothetical protein MLD38_005497 [Melastoma candidum]